MTSRPNHVTFAVSCTVVVVVMLLFLLNKTHNHLQDVQTLLLDADAKYRSLSRQFDSLFEYKDRLERSFINLKNERSQEKMEIDDTAREQLTVAKSNYLKQIQMLEEELSACRRREDVNSMITGDVVASKANEYSPPLVPLLAPLSHLTLGRGSHKSISTNVQAQPLNSKPSIAVQINNENVLAKDLKEKEAIQSPIGHVSAHPGQSGDPNEDTAGNLLV